MTEKEAREHLDKIGCYDEYIDEMLAMCADVGYSKECLDTAWNNKKISLGFYPK